MNKNKFKKLFYKFSCCLVCVLVLMQPLTVFAIPYPDSIDFHTSRHDTVYPVPFDPDLYVDGYYYNSFSIAGDSENMDHITFYYNLIQVYNYNLHDYQQTSFENTFDVCSSPFNIDILDRFDVSTQEFVFDLCMIINKKLQPSLTSDPIFNRIRNSSDCTTYIYYNPDDRCTYYVMVNHSIFLKGNTSQSYYQDNTFLSGVPGGAYSSGKLAYTFAQQSGTSQFSSNSIYWFKIPRYADDINDFSCGVSFSNNNSLYFGLPNLIYCSNPNKLPSEININNTPNYYLYSGLNAGVHCHFGESVLFPKLSDATPDFLNGANYCPRSMSGVNSYYLPFKFYFIGTVDSRVFDFSRFFGYMNFITFSGHGGNIVFDKYEFVSISRYDQASPNITMSCVTMYAHFINTSNEFDIYSSFSVDYYTSLNWTTSVMDNHTRYRSLPLNTDSNQDLMQIWNSLSGGFNFLTNIVYNFYNILPLEVYNLLTISLSLVLLLGTIRLIL